ncbi:unnamed protein product [Lactuca saligna]|uniref:Uncharacterized protein n=1 Tax=Lactuca saligna TaxID=75948 RepID=A0AA35VX84_LACSI|nr:unnamed protein product [Lactuca saligna]
MTGFYYQNLQRKRAVEEDFVGDSKEGVPPTVNVHLVARQSDLGFGSERGGMGVDSCLLHFGHVRFPAVGVVQVGHANGVTFSPSWTLNDESCLSLYESLVDFTYNALPPSTQWVMNEGLAGVINHILEILEFGYGVNKLQDACMVAGKALGTPEAKELVCVGSQLEGVVDDDVDHEAAVEETLDAFLLLIIRLFWNWIGWM